MDPIIILQSGVATGTVLLFATVGEILAERAGVLNLGVEGMMLMGAMSAYSVAVSAGSPWLGLIVAMIVAGLISLLHGFISIHLQADQVVSGLSLTFLGTGLSLIFGEGLTANAGGGFSERKDKPYTAKDIRFTRSKDGRKLYVIVLDWPGKQLVVKSLSTEQRDVGKIKSVILLGHNEQLRWSRDEKALTIMLPDKKSCEHAFAFRIATEKN